MTTTRIFQDLQSPLILGAFNYLSYSEVVELQKLDPSPIRDVLSQDAAVSISLTTMAFSAISVIDGIVLLNQYSDSVSLSPAQKGFMILGGLFSILTMAYTYVVFNDPGSAFEVYSLGFASLLFNAFAQSRAKQLQHEDSLKSVSLSPVNELP